ncbi:MAG: hypothetical protein QM645_01610 [Asticcacaulis sp.]
MSARRLILTLIGTGLLAVTPVRTQTAGPADSMETLAIRTMNICLATEAGGNLHTLATAQGYELDNNAYVRRFGDRWAFFFAYPVRNENGTPKGFACRLTIMSPKPIPSDPVVYRQTGRVMANGDRVMERLSNGPLKFANPFSVYYIEQNHPSRAGHKRTLLQRVSGQTGETIYLEDSHFTFEMLYAKGPRLEVAQPDMIDAVTDPSINAWLQEEITWLARNTFCAAKGGCPPAVPQKRARAASSGTNGGVYLNGSGNGARPLSSLEQDYYVGKGYVIMPRNQPSRF